MTFAVIADGLHDGFHWGIRWCSMRATAGNSCEGHCVEQESGEKFAPLRCDAGVFGTHEKNSSRQGTASILYEGAIYGWIEQHGDANAGSKDAELGWSGRSAFGSPPRAGTKDTEHIRRATDFPGDGKRSNTSTTSRSEGPKAWKNRHSRARKTKMKVSLLVILRLARWS
jgi:hypothetical protein